MNDLAVFIIGWYEAGMQQLADQLKVYVPHVFTYTNVYHSESENYNHCVRMAEEQGFHYMMGLDADVEVPHRETIPMMYEWISTTPNCGSVRPWRSGEEQVASHFKPEEKYIDDGTALMWRLNIGVYWSEEYIFTGWPDLDFGLELERKGYANYNDRRNPVSHSRAGSNRHGSSNILCAIKKRNKLVLDFKWRKVGRDKWQGVEAYNDSVPLEERIPSVNQLICYSNEEQDMFNQSVSPEHFQIWEKDGNINPNMRWKNPVIVGYSTREEFFKEYGYS